MITGKVIINGVDVKDVYGAYVVEGGYVDIPCIPERKQPIVNDWYEYDGVEADLDSPCCEPMRHTVTFMMKGGLDDLDSFMKFIRSKRVASYQMVDISRTLSLRVVSMVADGIAIGLYRVTVVLSEDNPLDGIEYQEPDNTKRPTGLKMDGNDLSLYGLTIVDTLDGLHPEVEVKDNLLHSSEYSSGESHYSGDGMPVTCTADDITVSAVMTAKTFNQFWIKRDALALELFKPGERLIEYNGRSVRTYYKDCRSRAFLYSGKIWWMLELSFGYLGE